MDEKSRHEKSLLNVMVFGTAMSFGILGAIMASMKDFFHGDASFTFSVRTLVGFVIGFAAGWLFWKIIRLRMHKTKP